MQFKINRKDFTCTIYFSNDTSAEVTMETPFTLSGFDYVGDGFICSDLVTIKYMSPKQEVIDTFEGVTADEFGSILTELQQLALNASLIDEAEAMAEEMHQSKIEAMFAGEPPQLNQADLQGGSNE